MRTKHLVSVISGAAMLLAVFPLFAQEEQIQKTGGTVIVEQQSELDAVGSWTLLQPNHESFERTDATLTIPGLLPGQYSFFVTAPKGTSTHIDVFLGDDVIKASETPQISFSLADTMTLKIVVRYTLTIFGKVGVSSEPAGVPFVLKGPDGFVKTGVTPHEFSPAPIGNYSVTYSPKGCPAPPTIADLLTNEGRADFNVKIVCSSFVPAKAEKKTAPGADDESDFRDVSSDAWYAPYIQTVVRRGVMAGYSDSRGESTGQFGPGDPVTIAQMAKIAHTAISLDENAVTGAPVNKNARGKWFTRYFASAEERGWLVYQDENLDPERPATRGEVMTTLLQILDIPVEWPTGTVFTDVARKTPYAGAIETAASEEIVGGSTNADGSPTGLFHPGDPITRAEIAKILINLHEKYQKGGSSSSAE